MFFFIYALNMATFYILYSSSLDKFYAGSSTDYEMQLRQHQKGHFPKGFKTETSDWEPYYVIDNIPLDTANRIVKHTKKNKSRDYYKSLKEDASIRENLIQELSSHRRNNPI